MAHDASPNPSVSGAGPKDRSADAIGRYGAKTFLLLVLGVLLVALGHPTKGPELARILGRLRKRHLDLIVGRVMDGLRLAEEYLVVNLISPRRQHEGHEQASRMADRCTCRSCRECRGGRPDVHGRRRFD
mgnify:CR=1 FL=1